MAATSIEPKVRSHGTIRVTLPAAIAYDPKALKKSIGELMARLGCPSCFSGADCLFRHERDFLVDPKGAIGNTVAGLFPEPWSPERAGPLPDPWRSSTVTASLSRGIRYDINHVFRAVDKIIDLIGPCPCHSGIDVLYQNELKTIGVNERGEAFQFGG